MSLISSLRAKVAAGSVAGAIAIASFLITGNERTKAYVEATEAYKQALGRGVEQSPPEAK